MDRQVEKQREIFLIKGCLLISTVGAVVAVAVVAVIQGGIWP